MYCIDVNQVDHNNPNAGGPQPNFLLRLVQKHYRESEYVRSEAKLRREEYLLPGVKFNRWYSMPAALIIQFCCGSLYAWSVFNKPIDTYIYGKVVDMAPITFYIAVGLFGTSAAIMGPWLERHGPGFACAVGSTLFFIGNLLTALAIYTKQTWLVFIGYGVVGGYGLGLCYISPVSCLQKWFPDRRGLASGLAVCGFGAGSIAVGKIILPLISAVGLPLSFVVFGCVYFVLMITCAMVLRIPPPGYTVASPGASPSIPSAKEEGVTSSSDVAVANQNSSDSSSAIKLSLIESLTSTEFRLMYVIFFANSIFGLVVISRLSNMIVDLFGKTADEASTIVSINGGANLAGRLIFSVASDYLGRKNCYIIMLTCQLIILGCFSTITNTQTYWAFLFTMFILTASYGGGFGVIPAFLTDMFGSKNIGACHGVILTAWSLAGVGGGLIFTAVYNQLIASGDYKKESPWVYNKNVWWIFGIVVAGWIVLFFLRTTVIDRLLPKVPGEIIRFRFFGTIYRFRNDGGFRVETVSKAQEESEWREFLSHRIESSPPSY